MYSLNLAFLLFYTNLQFDSFTGLKFFFIIFSIFKVEQIWSPQSPHKYSNFSISSNNPAKCYYLAGTQHVILMTYFSARSWDGGTRGPGRHPRLRLARGHWATGRWVGWLAPGNKNRIYIWIITRPLIFQEPKIWIISCTHTPYFQNEIGLNWLYNNVQGNKHMLSLCFCKDICVETESLNQYWRIVGIYSQNSTSDKPWK